MVGYGDHWGAQVPSHRLQRELLGTKNIFVTANRNWPCFFLIHSSQSTAPSYVAYDQEKMHSSFSCWRFRDYPQKVLEGVFRRHKVNQLTEKATIDLHRFATLWKECQNRKQIFLYGSRDEFRGTSYISNQHNLSTIPKSLGWFPHHASRHVHLNWKVPPLPPPPISSL